MKKLIEIPEGQRYALFICNDKGDETEIVGSMEEITPRDGFFMLLTLFKTVAENHYGDQPQLSLNTHKADLLQQIQIQTDTDLVKAMFDTLKGEE